MYLSHFGLNENPFRINTNPRFLWLGERHRKALGMMREEILSRDRHVVVTGDPGTGKTTLSVALAGSLSDRAAAAIVSYPYLGVFDFFKLVSAAYGLNGGAHTEGFLLADFETFLHNSSSSGKKVVLIIDEAQALNSEHLNQLGCLSNLEVGGNRPLNLVFMGQTELNDLFLKESSRGLRQQIGLFYDLSPFSEEETKEYIRHRLTVAGATRDIFTPEALNEVFQHSKGIARLINTICDYALLTAFKEDRQRVPPRMVKRCVDQFSIAAESTGAGINDSNPSPHYAEQPEKPACLNIRPAARPENVGEAPERPRRARTAYVAAMIGVVLFGVALLLFRYGSFEKLILPGPGPMAPERRVPAAADARAEKALLPDAPSPPDGTAPLPGDSSRIFDPSDTSRESGLKGDSVPHDAGVGEINPGKPHDPAPPKTQAARRPPAGSMRGQEGLKSKVASKEAAVPRPETVQTRGGRLSGHIPPNEESSSKGGEVESGEVIDWLIHKRLNKK